MATKAVAKLSTNVPLARKVADGLFEMETPLLRARGLVRAAFMAAGSSDIGGDAGDAIQALADTALELLEDLATERDRLAIMARDCAQEASRGQS